MMEFGMQANLGPSITHEFWLKLSELGKILVSIENANYFILGKEKNDKIFKTKNNLERNEIIIKIEYLVENLLKDLAEGRPMKFVFNKRGNARNTRFNNRIGLEMEDGAQLTEVSLDHQSSGNKFAVMLRALSMCYKLLQTNSYATKRDLFYLDKNFFGTQKVIDEAFTDLACLLKVPRNSLHVLASAKGCVAGNLVFKDGQGNQIDCSQTKTGVMVPNRIDEISDFYSSARFVLIVEKEASFQRFIQGNVIMKLGPCIIITAKGFPDVNTRIFLKKLWESLKIPMLAIMDCDPHGIEIMCVYRFGSKSLTFDAQNLTCPAIRWIGVQPADFAKMGIPKDALLPTTEADVKKINDLLKRPYIMSNPEIAAQIQLMLKFGVKAEIECLDAVSNQFATDVYLPFKIRSGDWL